MLLNAFNVKLQQKNQLLKIASYTHFIKLQIENKYCNTVISGPYRLFFYTWWSKV